MSLNSYRVRNIAVAVLLAVLAMAITLVYVSHARTQTNAPAPPASVLVAARDIPIGTAGDVIVRGGWIRTAAVPRDAVVPGAITDLAELKGLVAIQAVYAGEQITARRLGTASQQGLRADLHGTLRIVELPGDAHQLLAGTLRAGDHVDLLASLLNPETGRTHYARVVLRDLLVVEAAASSGGGTLGTGQTTTSIQLQLTDEQAQRLFWVQKNADWTLALRPAEDAASSGAAPASAPTVLGGGQ